MEDAFTSFKVAKNKKSTVLKFSCLPLK